jgi:alkanesulfonate monooxygenase SsuD/methylene tetrahydromethanopterin reductase-like flavin-dependent oxidoreductase (luciferase family)
MVLGIGASHQVTNENWFDYEIPKPVTQIREYASVVRAFLRGEPAPAGRFFKSNFAFMGYEVRPDLPIYIAGLSPNMLRLAGEIGDGVILWLCGPSYIRDTVIPAVSEGRERSGKTLEGFDVVAAVPSALTDDPGAARATMRRDLIPYMSLPFYRAMLERSGFGEEIAGFDAGMQAGDAEQGMAAISERMLEELFAIGSGDAVRGGISRYVDAGATSPGVSPIPGTDFGATLEAAAELL